MGIFDIVLQFGAVIASSIDDTTKEILDQVAGIGGIEDDNGDGEEAPAQRRYAPLGWFARPLPPDTSTGKSLFADVVCLKTEDGLIPIAWRDTRLNQAFPNGPKVGTIGMAGYGKGFYTLDLTSAVSGSAKANIHVIYCPYQFDSNGVPAKAHAIVLDPSSGNESVSMTHGDGYQISMLSGANGGISMNVDASTFLNMRPGTFTLNAAKIILQGNVAAGANAATAVPLLPGVASPPSSSFCVSSP